MFIRQIKVSEQVGEGKTTQDIKTSRKIRAGYTNRYGNNHLTLGNLACKLDFQVVQSQADQNILLFFHVIGTKHLRGQHA